MARAEQGSILLPWIKRVSLRDQTVVTHISEKLHAGERAAIALANEVDASLLADDRSARSEAHRFGLNYFGSLRGPERRQTAGNSHARERPTRPPYTSPACTLASLCTWDFLRGYRSRFSSFPGLYRSCRWRIPEITQRWAFDKSATVLLPPVPGEIQITLKFTYQNRLDRSHLSGGLTLDSVTYLITAWCSSSEVHS